MKRPFLKVKPILCPLRILFSGTPGRGAESHRFAAHAQRHDLGDVEPGAEAPGDSKGEPGLGLNGIWIGFMGILMGFIGILQGFWSDL